MKILSTRVLATAVLLALPVMSHAVVINVTTTVDVVDGADGLTSLREAFQTASANSTADEIVLAALAVYDLSDCVEGDLDHTASDPLVITGNDATVAQGCAGERVIDNNNPGSDLIVDDLTLTGTAGGAALSGAAIYTYNGLTALTNVTMTGLFSGGSGAMLEGDGLDGGLVYELTNVTIDGNEGSGISTDFGSVTIIDSTITDQTSAGVSLTDGSPLIIENSTVSGNGAGGVRTTGQGSTEMSLTDATITGNDGTGVTCFGCDMVSVTDSTISGNGLLPDTSSPGGGLRVAYDQDDPTDAPVTTITNSDIEDNISIFPGGGISVDVLESSELTAPPAALIIQDSSVSGNVTEGDEPMRGGGLYVETGGIELIDSNIDDNRAGPLVGVADASGGGVYIEEQGVITQTSDLTMTTSSINGNIAGKEGGGIYWRKAGELNVENSSIDDNEASASGGAVFSAGADLTLSESSVSGNTGLVGAGIRIVTFFDVPGGSLSVEQSTIDGNAASSFGGGIAVDADGFTLPILVKNSTISGNSAAGSGGGILTRFGGELLLDHATIADNSAPTGANLSLLIGGVSVGSLGTWESRASIIALPEGGDNCALDGGSPTSNGFNFADDLSCNLGVDDVQSMIDPELGPLADNGGSTDTHLPAPGSPAAGLVPAGSCLLAVDQRNSARPQGPDCDAGAVEIIETSAPVSSIVGTPGDDFLVGTPADDVIIGMGGDDVMLGMGGNDVLEGGTGHDLLFGGPGDDLLKGQRGRDILVGEDGDDDLRGGRGRDFLLGGLGFDLLNGGGGRDICVPSGGNSVGC